MSIALEKKGTSLKKTIRYYSLTWSVFFVICVLLFYLLRGKSFFLDDDGLHQQYSYFAYTGIWIRRIFDNLFVKHIFELPMWDMSIGMGADPILTFLVGTDPINWVSALFPVEFSEYVFNIVIVLKLYLVGLSFVLFSFEKGHGDIASVAGSMVYTFSSITYVTFSQAGFLPLFYLFPLLMIGVNRLWTGKGYRLYVLILALGVMFSTYFVYMMGLMIIVYCVIRFFTEKKSLAELPKLLGRFVAFSVLGIGIGIGPSLPATLNLRSLDRFDIEQHYTVFSVKGVDSLLKCFFSYIDRSGIYWGVSAFVAVAVIVLFMRRGNNLLLKILFMLYSAAFLFPIVGSVFNGLNFSSERYIFGYILLLGYIVTVTFDDIGRFKGVAWYLALAVGMIMLVFQYLSSDTNAVISGISFVICVFTVGLVNSIASINEKKRSILYMLTVLLSCFLLGYAGLWRMMTPFSVSLGEANEIMTLSTGDDLIDPADLSNKRFDRIPYSFPEVQINSSMLTGRCGYDFYHSNYNSYVHQFYYDIGSFSNDVNTYRGFRGQLYPELLCGTKYIIRDTLQDRCINAPYSYTKVTDNGEYGVYEADGNTSLVYFYNDTLSYEDFDNCSLMDREDLLMRYCVVSEGATSTVHDLSESYNIIEFERVDDEVSLDRGGYFTVGENGICIELTFDEISLSDLILELDGITGKTAQGDMYYQVAVASVEDDEIRNADFWVGISETYKYYQGEGNLLFDFGYSDSTINGIRIYISTPGEYSIDDIGIYSRSKDQMDQTIDSFYEHADMENIDCIFDGNHIHINANTDHDSYLYIAVPYSEGWHAVVDGESTAIIRANRAFMAIPVGAGDHNIELVYRTPFLVTGSLISIFSILVFIFINMKTKKNVTKEQIVK